MHWSFHIAEADRKSHRHCVDEVRAQIISESPRCGVTVNEVAWSGMAGSRKTPEWIKIRELS